MAKCSNVKITLYNATSDEIKVKKFEYKDGSDWDAETGIFGLDGSDKIEPGKSKSYTRDLGGIGGESTRFRVTYCHHIGGSSWGSDVVEYSTTFTCVDGCSKTVTLDN